MLSKVENVFNVLKQIGLLKRLEESERSILFVGDHSMIEYLENVFRSRSSNHSFSYIEFEAYQSGEELELFKGKIDVSDWDAVVVASISNEIEVIRQLKDVLHTNVLGLFGDLFVNCVSCRNLLDTISLPPVCPSVSYAIVSTPRSGSTFLCDALNSTNLAGFPREHLREPSLFLARACNFSLDSYMRKLMQIHVTPNNVFGTKLISHFIERHIQASNDKFEPFSYFSKYIYLVRKDKVSQAISLFLARQSGVWHVDKEEKLSLYQKSLEQSEITDGDLEEIHDLYIRIVREESYIESLFEKYKISPITLVYENLHNNLSNQIREVMLSMGIIGEQEEIQVSVAKKKMSSGLNERLYKLYVDKYTLS